MSSLLLLYILFVGVVVAYYCIRRGLSRGIQKAAHSVEDKVRNAATMEKKEWLEYFEAINGRKPTAGEWETALDNGEFENSKPLIKEVPAVDKKVSQDFITNFIVANQDKFRGDDIQAIRALLSKTTVVKAEQLLTIEFINPTTITTCSILLGGLGIDRFMLGQLGLGLLKLITGGFLGIWTIVDWFTVGSVAKQKNYEKVLHVLTVPVYQSSLSADISQANSPSPYERTYVVDERGENIGFGRAISDYFRGYFDFKGYTTRKGYWFASLFVNILVLITYLVVLGGLTGTFSSGDSNLSAYWLLFAISGSVSYYLGGLLIVFPSLTLMVRRLRDVGLANSGIVTASILYVISLFIPVINIFTTLAWWIVLGFLASNTLAKPQETFWFRSVSDYETKPSNFQPKVSYLWPTLAALVFLIFPVVASQVNKNSTTSYDDYTSSSSYQSSSSSEVDLSDYEVSLYVDGEDGSGTAYAEVDTVPYLSTSDSEINDFLKNPKITVSKKSGLSNGDRVEVKLTLDEDKAEELGLTLTGEFYEYYTISKLDEKADEVYSSSSSSEDINAVIEKIVNDYRSDINAAFASRDGSLIRDNFTSSSNKYYLDTKDYVDNHSAADGIASYESKTTRVYDIEQNGDTLSFTVDYTTISHYTNGTSSGAINNNRHYVCKKINGKYLIESF